jgi:3-methyl-2-oxobutanoate hydroxymethyltransferase
MSTHGPLANKKIGVRDFKKFLSPNAPVMKWLTCYDFQTAQMLNETEIDAILVGDSLGNVILGYDTTLPVKLEEMILFAKAVRRGAPDKFLVVDMPFGSYMTLEEGTKNAVKVLQETEAEAIKIEGHSLFHEQLIAHLKTIGIPVIGHIGLTPQFVHQMGGYYMHGKDHASEKRLHEQALGLQQAGVVGIVLECVVPEVTLKLVKDLEIPSIGIGSGMSTSGQILVINDLFGLGKNPAPKFCPQLANLYEHKKELLAKYFTRLQKE